LDHLLSKDMTADRTPKARTPRHGPQPSSEGREATSAPSPTRDGPRRLPPRVPSDSDRSRHRPGRPVVSATGKSRDADPANRSAGPDVGNVPPPLGAGRGSPRGLPRPLASGRCGRPRCGRPGPMGSAPRRGRLFCSLTIRSFVTQPSVVVALFHLHERGTLEKREIVTGRRPRRVARRSGRRHRTSHPPRSAAGPARAGRDPGSAWSSPQGHGGDA
jgi:hypothetical protein